MKTLNIKRTRQLFAFNQTVSLFMDGKFCGKLMNGDRLALRVNSETSRLEARTCFGSKAVLIDSEETAPNNITIRFGTSDLNFVLIIALFISLATVILWMVWYADFNFSFFIMAVSSFFIIRNRKQLRIIKN